MEQKGDLKGSLLLCLGREVQPEGFDDFSIGSTCLSVVRGSTLTLISNLFPLSHLLLAS